MGQVSDLNFALTWKQLRGVQLQPFLLRTSPLFKHIFESMPGLLLSISSSTCAALHSLNLLPRLTLRSPSASLVPSVVLVTAPRALPTPPPMTPRIRTPLQRHHRRLALPLMSMQLLRSWLHLLSLRRTRQLPRSPCQCPAPQLSHLFGLSSPLRHPPNLLDRNQSLLCSGWATPAIHTML